MEGRNVRHQAGADDEPQAMATATAAAAAASPRTARPHGRRRLPTNLPRETRHYELTAAERTCATCGQVRVEIVVVIETGEEAISQYRAAPVDIGANAALRAIASVE